MQQRFLALSIRAGIAQTPVHGFAQYRAYYPGERRKWGIV
jgi:hypothetical protein